MLDMFGKSNTYQSIEFESHSEWYRKTTNKINDISLGLDKRDSKRYRIDLLLNIVRRVDTFYGMCDECQKAQTEISDMVDALYDIVRMQDNDRLKDYLAWTDRFTKHLKDTHKLVKKGHYASTISMFSIALGAVSATILKDFEYASIVVPVVLILIGLALDYKAKKEGRVI